jgi:hypothetical protein
MSGQGAGQTTQAVQQVRLQPTNTERRSPDGIYPARSSGSVRLYNAWYCFCNAARVEIGYHVIEIYRAATINARQLEYEHGGTGDGQA